MTLQVSCVLGPKENCGIMDMRWDPFTVLSQEQELLPLDETIKMLYGNFNSSIQLSYLSVITTTTKKKKLPKKEKKKKRRGC